MKGQASDMPLAGGPSDKYGNRFEGKWTVYCIAQVMAEEADSIRLEPPGPEGEGSEFVLRKADLSEYHQVKRQHARPGNWTIAELAGNGVLRHCFIKTREPNGCYVFISTTSTGILESLVDDARRAESFSEFKEHFLTGDKSKAWEGILREWCGQLREDASKYCTASTEDIETVRERVAYEHLRRFKIRHFDEDTLTEMVETRLRTLVRSDPSTVRRELADLALEKIHALLYGDAVWSYLQGQGYRRVDYSRDTSILAKLDELNARYESMIKGIGNGITIPRKEAANVMDILKGDGPKASALVSGEAGVGKTCVLGQAIHQLKSEGTPHLYFRVDRLEPTDLPSNVSTQLGLPSTPIEVLAGVAQGRRCILIVDQLDAVSLVSGRNPDFFHCIHEMIRQTVAFPNMRLLLACRRFDIEKDNRLRELVSEHGLAQEVNVKSLAAEEVIDVLEQLGCEPSDYGNSQIESLRLPLHLALFAEVIQGRLDKAFHFSTSIELFAGYWDLKRAAVSSRTGLADDHWVKVLDRLCDKMTERQTLLVPEAEVVDEHSRTVRAMESESVLILDGGRVGFFHEGFFDYIFARRFLARGRDLIEYLKEGEQGLFKRAPLRQILLHYHAMDHADFVRVLRRVILDSSIRFHLRRCALETVAKVECASPELWSLFKDILSSSDNALIREVWRVLWAAAPWFSFLHGKGLIASWLASDDPDQRQRALTLVRTHIQTYPDKCIDLLLPFVGVSDEWNAEILSIVCHRVLATDRRAFDLFMNLHKIGVVKNEGHLGFWTCVNDLPENQPTWAAEALGQRLRLAVADLQPEDVKWPVLGHDVWGQRLVLKIAERAPAPFLDEVLPFFLDVVRRTRFDRDGTLALDRIWHFRSCREEALDFSAALLQGIEDAFGALARNSLPDFTRFLDLLLPYGDYDSVNFVIVRALTAAPTEFADDTVDYLLVNPRRLECGWSSGGGGNFQYWAGRELVKHVASKCGDGSFARLEQALIDHFPRWEKSKGGFKTRGYWQMVMLPALPIDRRSARTEARLSEWQRKFPKMVIQPPVGSNCGFVGSPIKVEAISRMKDDDWLRALEVYDTEDAPRRRSRGFLEGGPHELSGVLESETKRHPARFADLSSQFPANTHPYYYHALLRGLKESDADKDTVLAVVRRVFALPNNPGHRYLCDAIAKFSLEELPEDILGIVGWCATEAEGPESDELTVRISGKEEDERPKDLLTTAINSVRGAAAETVGTLLFDKADRVRFFMPYLERMATDPTVIVRTTVAQALLCLYKHDQVRAVDLFLVLVDIGDDLLLTTHYVDRFLYYADILHFHRLRAVLRRMLNSSVPAVREAGARHVCLAQFNNPDAASMAAECVGGDDAQRKGAAAVAAGNLFHSDCVAYTHATLPVFFNDPAKEVRDIAAQCFHDAKNRNLETARPIIKDFLTSAAFGENVEDLLWPMVQSTADIAEEALLTCEAVIGLMEALGGGTMQPLYVHANNIAELVLRVYRQTEEPSIRSRCLDIVDRLLAQEEYGMSKELEEFQR